MADQLATFQEKPQHSQNVTIGESPNAIELRVRLTRRERTASWYIDMFDLDDVPIILGQRVSENWAPFEGYALTTKVPGLPEDIVFIVQGPSPYKREDLGDTLLIFAYTEDEIAAARAQPTGDAVIVTVAP